MSLKKDYIRDGKGKLIAPSPAVSATSHQRFGIKTVNCLVAPATDSTTLGMQGASWYPPIHPIQGCCLADGSRETVSAG